MDLGEKIKNRRIDLDLTLEEVGNIVGVTKSTVMKWETGSIENMRRDKIALLSKALKVSPLWIMGVEDKNITSGTISVPLLGQIAAGVPILAEENIEDYFNIDTKVKADFALKIKGNSMMDAGILPGDIVFIKQQCDLENGQIGAILIEEEATLKKFYKEDDTIILQAENEDYKPMIYKEGNIKILGKLVAVLNLME